ncbi:MAG: FtsX-like permease family protein [Anaerolineae bacterium]|nr:MAG: FtsX-like permease family protein [Anaerolineae bacterium]
MNLLLPFVEALESLSSNKLRSGLTILGIVIGVAAVIAMLAIGNGAEATITGSIEGIGTNLLFVIPGGGQDVRNPKPLTLGDAEALRDPLVAPSVLNVAPALQSTVEVSYGGETAFTNLSGVTAEYSPVRNSYVTEGEFINVAHVLGRASVAVIGTGTAEDLFGRKEGLVGETIRIDGQPFRIIGVLEEKGGQFQEDDAVMIPLSTAQVRVLRRNTSDQVDAIFAQSIDGESVDLAVEEISQVLRARHRSEIGQDDFSVLTQRDFLATFETITGVLTIFLGGIAGISLVVGGIGIMNIMLVSVIERTREIGLRKAVGARKRDILIQFLLESLLLSLLGGFIGILLGWGLSALVGAIAAASNTDLVPLVGVDAILLSTVFSSVVGLLSGIYPAFRAANLEPVEALRYE